MNEQEARDLLRAAVRKRDATAKAANNAREAVYDAVRQVAPVLKQVDIARETKWTREHIRNIVDGKK